MCGRFPWSAEHLVRLLPPGEKETALSWCDKLASTPTVGFGLDWHFETSDAVLAKLSPLLDPLVKHERAQFTVTKPDAFALSVSRQDGFLYGFDPSKISVGFQHSLKFKAVSGGPPTMEMLSRPMPYTELLVTVSDMLLDAVVMVVDKPERKINRIGVVTTTAVDQSEAPPGIKRFIDVVGRPWKGALDNFSFQIVSVLDKGNPKCTDRCVHAVTRPENPEELLTIVFDWQRSFATGLSARRDSLRDILSRATKDALAYFEDLAEGSRFDEDDLHSSTA